MAEQTMTLSDAMQLAIASWEKGSNSEALHICQRILEVRPHYAGALHLRSTIEHGVRGLEFTAIRLHDTERYDVGAYSYGVPAVFHHNQPGEPARLRIGSYCTIGHDVKIILGSYHRQDWHTIYPFSAPHFGSLFPSSREIKDYSSTRGGVTIGSDVWIGAHSIILSGVEIGDGAVIGAGSVVSKDVGPYEIWAGNPARLVRRRFDQETSERLLTLRWWDWPKEDVQANVRSIMSEGGPALVKLASAKREMLRKANGKRGQDRVVTGRTGFVRLRMPQVWRKGAPVWVVLHGSLGSIETVADFAEHIPEANLVFVDLPGSGQSWAPVSYSAEAFAAELLPAFREVGADSYHVLGVSFGGAVGLEVARRDSRCKGVVLLDTPFSARKLWHNHAFLRRVLENTPDNQHAHRFAWEIYGVTAVAETERTFWHLLDEQSIPITVVTGDVPMLPVRALPPVPCCLDAADLKELRRRGVAVVSVKGGHDLLHDNPEAVARIMNERGRGMPEDAGRIAAATETLASEPAA